ncbi:hypothetical protein BU25DRAFT_17418 [Macroventuria anomochaeta]|uniref:Uncharacterized protein n=1 Tax=Macroventuria anomochaeta TaxID=301207 RepID=A0ACB6SI06_9PLEO|nr:uncharacterized protein BU25DRAFT_17418 [Macroventuria anomochaeta]KAF2633981.1 hypothetical protein BU25DRAFT_17418 [Macroventuria anomochaeta]
MRTRAIFNRITFALPPSVSMALVLYDAKASTCPSCGIFRVLAESRLHRGWPEANPNKSSEKSMLSPLLVFPRAVECNVCGLDRGCSHGLAKSIKITTFAGTPLLYYQTPGARMHLGARNAY